MFRVHSPPQPSTGSDSFIHPQLLRVYKVNILGFDGLTRFGVFWDTESGLGFRDSLGLRNFGWYEPRQNFGLPLHRDSSARKIQCNT